VVLDEEGLCTFSSGPLELADSTKNNQPMLAFCLPPKSGKHARFACEVNPDKESAARTGWGDHDRKTGHGSHPLFGKFGKRRML